MSQLYEKISDDLYMCVFDFFKKKNIAYVIHDKINSSLIGIDFGAYSDTKAPVSQLEKKLNANLKYIISTHSHYDHADGNYPWKLNRKNIQIIGGYSPDESAQVPFANQLIKDNQTLNFSSKVSIKFIHTPGHLKSSYCLLLNNKNLFTGDSLFNGSLAGIYNGNYKEYYQSMNKLKKISEKIDPLVLCGHDFTLQSLKFCYFLDQTNQTLLKMIKIANDKKIQNKLAVGISTLKEEMKYNPFLLCDSQYYKDYTKQEKGEDVFRSLLAIKETFKKMYL